MKALELEEISKKLVEYSAIASLALFFAIHVYFSFIYHSFNGELMIYLNRISFMVIAAGAVLVYHRQFHIMFNMIFIEAMFHVLMATMSFGWDCGFQNYLIAMVVMIYFVDYCYKKSGAFKLQTYLLVAASIIMYLIAFSATNGGMSIYEISDSSASVAQVISTIIIFAAVAVCMWSLIQFTLTIESRMSNKAMNDELTGLPNRYYFTENFAELIGKCTKETMFMAIMDIDDFKKVNDTYGHNTGDYVLKTVADIIKDKCSEMIVCRWGGEEFLLSGESDGTDEDARKRACRKLDDIRKSIGNYDFEYEGNRFRITLTMGVSFYGEGETVEDWVGCADKRLYSGKMSGKNKLVYEKLAVNE